MLQAASLQRARLPLLALALLSLAAFTALTAAPRLNVGTSSQSVIVAERVTAPTIQSTVVTPAHSKTETSACGSGAYVTGDLAGDASPATVYATLCGTR
jgi:hypothetical protein